MADTQIVVGMNVDGVVTGTEKAKRKISELGTTARDAGKGTGTMGDGAAQSATKVEAGTKRMVADIQRTTAVMAAGERGSVAYYESLAKMRGVDVVTLRPFLDQLDAALTKQRIDGLGVSAKQLSANLRVVPAQFTDIVTSIQGGQAPLTVFLQQGGQLKDMFGGAGNAAKAMASYVLGLVNPFTLSAAAVAAAAYAYKQATDETDAYRKSTVLSGNAIGTTIGQLQDSAKNIGSTTTATVGAAADALQQMAASGSIASGDIERLTLAAIRFEKMGGSAIKDTVKAYAELANDPVAASEKLNKQYNYLTASVYSQIKALDQQGDKTGAVSLAQSQFADAQERMATEIESGLGRIEQAWDLAGVAAKKAWDQFVGAFRPDSIDKVISDLESRMKFGQGFYGVGGQDKQKIQDQLDYWKHIKASNDDYAASQKVQAQQTSAQIELDRAYIAGLDKVSKARLEIAGLSGAFAFVDQTPENIAKYTNAVQGILDRSKDGSKGGTKKDPNADTNRYAENLQKQIEKTQELTTVQQLGYDINAGRLGKMTAAQQNELVGLAVKLDATKAQTEAEKELSKALADRLKNEQDSLGQLDSENASLIERLTSSTPTKQFESQQADLAALQTAFADGTISVQLYGEAVAELFDLNNEKIKETTSLAADLGLTFVSAAEDAILNWKGLSGVLVGLEQDILRIATRKLVTEPLGNAVTGMLGGAGANIGTGFNNLLADLIGISFDGGGYTGNGPRSGGLDGKGGFLAVMHPQEDVVDRTKGQRVGGGNTVHVSITQQFAPGTTRQTTTQAAAEARRQLSYAGRNL